MSDERKAALEDSGARIGRNIVCVVGYLLGTLGFYILWDKFGWWIAFGVFCLVFGQALVLGSSMALDKWNQKKANEALSKSILEQHEINASFHNLFASTTRTMNKLGDAVIHVNDGLKNFKRQVMFGERTASPPPKGPLR